MIAVVAVVVVVVAVVVSKEVVNVREWLLSFCSALLDKEDDVLANHLPFCF